MNLGGLFKLYVERRDRQSADYVIVADADFGPAHLQNSILPGTVSNIISNIIKYYVIYIIL